MKIDKKYKVSVIALLGIVLCVFIFFIISKKGVKNQDLNSPVKELPLKVESTPLSFSIVNTPEGNILECVYKNDSEEDISRIVLEVKLKDTGEIVELKYNDIVKAGKESAKFTGKGPASGNVEDVEVLKYKISTRNGTYMEYDTELKQYNWS
ncbi:hypothetical protein [Clostridium sp.]|uniref:hypothetical protein n=1 Tax=Clostridium sp. TaxID=1506 RepID=UPI002620664A|nr:hypothetical protein [Clostridium sp.]